MTGRVRSYRLALPPPWVRISLRHEPQRRVEELVDAVAASFTPVGDLEAARTACSSALETYNDKADEVARKIRDAADDDVKDSRWDRFKNWIDENAGWSKTVADIIGWVVTIVAVVSLFLTPAGWIIAIVAAVAVLGVGIRVMLAASGNGSWMSGKVLRSTASSLDMAAATGAVTDLIDKTATVGDWILPGSPYGDFKDRFSLSPGGHLG